MRAAERYHFKRIGNPRYIGLAQAILKTLDYHPTLTKYKSAIDVGSSCGVLLDSIDKASKLDLIYGVDASKYAKKLWQCKNGTFIQSDLNAGAPEIPHTFDIITCIEVAEHLEQDAVLINFFNTLSNKDSVLFFSAAHPKQKAKGHINMHWHSWWRKRVEDSGWYYNHQMTMIFAYTLGLFKGMNGGDMPSYYLNTLVFQKAGDENSEDGLLH